MDRLAGRYRLRAIRVFSIAFDLVVAATAFIASYATVYGTLTTSAGNFLANQCAFFVLISGIAYYIFSVHLGSWRYVSIPELIALIKAAFFAVSLYTLLSFLLSRGADVPRSVPILLLIYLVSGLSAARLSYRLLVERRLVSPFRRGASTPAPRYVLLVGMTPEAESFVRSTKRLPDTPVEVLGIIDDTQSNTAQTVHGVKVHRGLGRLPRIIRSSASAGLKVSELIVAEPNASPQRLNTIMEAGSNVGLRVSRVPSLTRTASITTASLLESKPIEIGDLLGRPEIRTDVEGMARLVHNQVVLVTGAAGSIGSELCRQIATFRPKMMVIADNSEFQLYELDKRLRQSVPTLSIATRIVDVRDAARVSSVMREFLPDIVFHAAALKHVPLVEENPLEGIKTNVFGTRNVANAALGNKVSTFVMISTDKAVNPTNLMGASKRAAEVYCQTLDLTAKTTRFKTVRFGNVLGSNGSVVPRFQEQIAAGGPVTVTHPDIERFFMTIPEAVRLVLHASARALRNPDERGRIMVLDMGRPVKIVDLAERMIQLAGFKPRQDIKIEFTGLRPGEKLYEELFDPSEMQDASSEEGYFTAAPRVVEAKVVNKALETLQTAVEREDRAQAIAIMRTLVPEYDNSGAPAPQVVLPAHESHTTH